MIEAEKCRRSLAEFIRRAWHAIEPSTEYLRNWHIELICEYLEAVTAGQITRLLLNIPPRYMKSSSVSVMWPLWEWTFRPHTRWMFATYAQSLSDDHSLKRMTILKSDWYRSHWGDSVVLTKENIATVMNDRLGVFESTSFAGTATGKGANRLVIDDPHNPKMAESDLERETTLRDFNTTFSTRLNDKKRDAIVVVMQRLHQYDVSARCVELGYVHLCLPAESEGRSVVRFPTSGRELVREDGELLWPEREGPEEIASVKVALGEYGYAGQYQQRPAPKTGGMFPASWPFVAAIPAGSKFVRAWDKAGTAGGGAYSAGVKLARSPDGRYFVVDVVRGQWSASDREAAIKQAAILDTPNVPVVVEQEPGSGGKESAENTVINLAGFHVEAKAVSGDKETRARPFASQSQVGNVYLVEGPWNQAFVGEAQLFPYGRYKDQIDAAAMAFNKLALAPAPPKLVTFENPLRGYRG